MKIGIDISALSSKPTGTGRYIKTLLECLDNCNSDYLTFSHTERKKSSDLISRIPIIKRGGLQRHFYRYFNLKREMLEAGIDAAIFPNYFMPSNFRKPAAVIIHDLSFISHPQFYSPLVVRYYRNSLKKTLAQNPLVVTISEHSRKRISEHTGISERNICLLQSYVSLKEYPNMSVPVEKSDYFLFVGHVEPRKNIEFMIKNFIEWKKLTGVKYKLVIAGEIWIKSPSVKRILREFQNHSDVILKGFVDEATLDNLYRNASAFLHTSFEEGFGLPVLEAMSYGLPVLCTAGTATSEISSPRAVTIQPDDNNSMIEGLNKLQGLILEKEKTEYNHPYSPKRMQQQLNDILDRLACKTHPTRIHLNERAASVKEAVEKTLLYASLFKSGLNRKHLHEYLFDLKVSNKELDVAIQHLLTSRKIIVNKDIYFLNNRSAGFYKLNRTGLKKDRADELLSLIKKIPFIKAIAFSGGTANYGIENHDDLDLFIITKPNSVYIVYLIVHLLSLLKSARKELCVNHLIDEMNQEVKSQQDLFIAHQIISLVPYKNEIAINEFLSHNKWISEFFPNLRIKSVIPEKSSLFYKLLFPVNASLKYLYKFLYMKKTGKLQKKGSVMFENRILKLHTNDHRRGIMNLFTEAWEKYSTNNTGYDNNVNRESLVKSVTESENAA